MTPARIDWHLDNWAEWHQSARNETGYAANPDCINHNWYSKTIEEMLEPIERRCAEAVEAIVWELPSVQSAAILHNHFAAVFRFCRTSLVTAYDVARERVGDGLDKRGIY